jgi:PhzF family phenazine biosynthesis protein
MPSTTYHVVDAFTDVPFSGNPAGVVVLPDVADDRRDEGRLLSCLRNPSMRSSLAVERAMQKIAAEINVSETAFVWRYPDEPAAAREEPEEERDEGAGITTTREARDEPRAVPVNYVIRYFTPAVEISLCGHATLAAAKVLWETEQVARDRKILFQAREERLQCSLEVDGRISMVFPRDELESIERCTEEHNALLEGALSMTPGECDAGVRAFKGRLNKDYLVVIPDHRLYSNLDAMVVMEEVKKVNDRYGMRGVIVSAPGDVKGGTFDFSTRFFAPNCGIPEDPVTGSSFPTLARYYSPLLNKKQLVGIQCHPRRQGFVRVEELDDGVTVVSGSAVIVSRCEFLI